MSTPSTRPHTPRERAVAFLKEHLGDGRRLPQRTVMKMANEQGISVRTLYRARLGLVRSVHVGFGKGSEWVWVLKDQEANLSKTVDESLATSVREVSLDALSPIPTVQEGDVATFGKVRQEDEQDQAAVLGVVPAPQPASLPVGGVGGVKLNLISLVKQEEGVDTPVSTALPNYSISVNRVDGGDRSALTTNSLLKDGEQVDGTLNSPVHLFSVDNNYSLSSNNSLVDRGKVDRKDISSPSCHSLVQDIGEEGVALLLTPPFQPVLLLLLLLADGGAEDGGAARLAARSPAGGKLPGGAALPHCRRVFPAPGPIGLARGPSVRLLGMTHKHIHCDTRGSDGAALPVGAIGERVARLPWQRA